MDDFFDKLKDSVSKAKDSAEKIAREVAKRTSNTITHTKLSFSMNEVQSKIKDIYAEIGKELYAKYLNGEETDESIHDSFAQIDKLMDEIEIINSKIAELKNSVKCPECSTFNSAEAGFCSHCGASLDNAPSVDEDIVEVEVEEVIEINPKKPDEE